MSTTEEGGNDRYPVSSPTMIMILQARRLEARVEEELKAVGLSLRWVGLLGHLSREPGISYSALARRAGIKVQSLHPIMDRLTDAGYVTTVGEVGQGRAAVIRLTEHGRDALGRAQERISAIDREHFAGEWEDLGRALVRLGDASRLDGDSSAPLPPVAPSPDPRVLHREGRNNEKEPGPGGRTLSL